MDYKEIEVNIPIISYSVKRVKIKVDADLKITPDMSLDHLLNVEAKNDWFFSETVVTGECIYEIDDKSLEDPEIKATEFLD